MFINCQYSTVVKMSLFLFHIIGSSISFIHIAMVSPHVYQSILFTLCLLGLGVRTHLNEEYSMICTATVHKIQYSTSTHVLTA